MKKIVFALSLVLIAVTVHAQENGLEKNHPEPAPRPEARQAIKNNIETLRAGLQQNREETRGEIKNLRASTTEAIRGERNNLRNELASSTLPRPEKRDDIRAFRASSTEMRRGMRADIRDMRASSTEDRKALRASSTAERKDIRKKALDEVKKQRVETVTDRVGKNFNEALDRVINIDERIQSRIVKVKAAGKDTAAAEALLVTAQSSLNTAKAKVQVLKDLLDTIGTTGEISDQTKTDVKTASQDAKSALYAAYNAYGDVVKNLQTIDPQPKPQEDTNSTNTPEVQQ